MDLNFDKSLSLAGYPITFADNDFFYDPTIKNPYKFIGHLGEYLKEIFTPLQPTIHITIVPHGSFLMNEDGTKIGSSLLKILNGTFATRAAMDNQRIYGDFWRNELIEFSKSGICYVVADKTGSWGEYFNQNYFLPILVSVVYICLVIETLVKYYSQNCKIEVVMDLLRVTIGNATLQTPKTSFKRIIFLLIIFPYNYYFILAKRNDFYCYCDANSR